jgi:hypothetical protein
MVLTIPITSRYGEDRDPRPVGVSTAAETFMGKSQGRRVDEIIAEGHLVDSEEAVREQEVFWGHNT